MLTDRFDILLFLLEVSVSPLEDALMCKQVYNFKALSKDVNIEERDDMLVYAQKLEKFVIGITGVAIQINEVATIAAFERPLDIWAKTYRGQLAPLTLVDVAYLCGSRQLIAHPVVQSCLQSRWTDRLHSNMITGLVIILLSMFPPFCILVLLFAPKAWLLEEIFDVDFDANGRLCLCARNTHPKCSHMTAKEGKRHEETFASLHVKIDAKIWPERSRRHVSDSGSRFASGLYDRLHLLCAMLFAIYRAPICKFWLRQTAYAAFLLLYTVVVLGDMPAEVIHQREVLLVIWTALIGFDEVQEMSSIGWADWRSNHWNILTVVMLALFFAAYGIRWHAILVLGDFSLDDSEALSIYLGFASVAFFFRAMASFRVYKEQGTLLLIIEKMLGHILSIMWIMFVGIMAFGVGIRVVLNFGEGEWLEQRPDEVIAFFIQCVNASVVSC